VLRVRQDFQAFLDGVTPEFRIEHRLRRDAGRPRWVLCRAAAARDSEGRVVRVSGSLTNIDQHKTLDPLTGLGNRQYLQDVMAAAISQRADDGESVPHTWMLLLLDVHGFRDYNDVGQEAGDRLLVNVANRLSAAIGASGFSTGATLARCGHDEFAVLAHRAVDVRDAGALAEILLAVVFDPLAGEDGASHVSANIGVAFSNAAGVTLDQMLTDADLALKVARAEGPNRWHVSLADLKERARLRAATARDFRHAVERDQLVAHYQPQIDLATRKVMGFEALMRWRHPERGLLPPSEFISIAEKTGLIVAAGEWILEEACRQLRIWQDQLPCVPPTTVAVNISPRQLDSPNLLEHLRRVLEETGIPPATLHLEVTESCLMDEKESARKVLVALRATGVQLDLDDFGTGYASLAYLNVVHFDALKIDKSFVLRMDSDGESFAIIKTIMALAQDLHMGVVAEGIETESQLRQLTGLGCKSGQGFYFARPVDAQVAGELLRLSQQSPVHELFVA
jgi:diguanylate cyclase (GGDEF)-like protein